MLSHYSKLKHRHQVIFSVIIGFAVVCFWRGVWGFLDEYLFPSNYPLSLLVSFVMGLTILVMTHYATKALV